MADASVEQPPVDNPLFEFDRKFLGAHRDETFTTLGAWVGEKLGEDDDHDLLLQMDIEGGEFDVLIESDKSLLRRCRMMVIEFHRMESIFERNSLPLLHALFTKLHQDFVIVHSHANSCCGIAESFGVGIPPVFEISYLRRDRVANQATGAQMHLQHALDRPNVPENPDIVMPDLWWR
ncbi:MAG: FkbM family methyltransferase [Gammaproteobacteria bacterium]|nr:FkbM family methyltransferase [Gammaproteobacteria bacterium]